MGLPCITPMQPSHQAVVALSSSSSLSPPCLRLFSSSTFCAPSCAHGEQQQRARCSSDAPSETSIPVPQAVKALYLGTPPTPPPPPTTSRTSAFSFQHQNHFVLYFFPPLVVCFNLIICQIRRCVWLGCHTVATSCLGIYFGGNFLSFQQLSRKVNIRPHLRGILPDSLVLLREVIKYN